MDRLLGYYWKHRLDVGPTSGRCWHAVPCRTGWLFCFVRPRRPSTNFSQLAASVNQCGKPQVTFKEFTCQTNLSRKTTPAAKAGLAKLTGLGFPTQHGLLGHVKLRLPEVVDKKTVGRVFSGFCMLKEHPSKSHTSDQCWVDVGPQSQTVL